MESAGMLGGAMRIAGAGCFAKGGKAWCEFYGASEYDLSNNREGVAHRRGIQSGSQEFWPSGNRWDQRTPSGMTK
jgi:hypothetical protein